MVHRRPAAVTAAPRLRRLAPAREPESAQQNGRQRFGVGQLVGTQRVPRGHWAVLEQTGQSGHWPGLESGQARTPSVSSLQKQKPPPQSARPTLGRPQVPLLAQTWPSGQGQLIRVPQLLARTPQPATHVLARGSGLHRSRRLRFLPAPASSRPNSPTAPPRAANRPRRLRSTKSERARASKRRSSIERSSLTLWPSHPIQPGQAAPRPSKRGCPPSPYRGSAPVAAHPQIYGGPPVGEGVRTLYLYPKLHDGRSLPRTNLAGLSRVAARGTKRGTRSALLLSARRARLLGWASYTEAGVR